MLSTATKHRDSYEKLRVIFCKLLSASNKETPLIEIMEYIDEIMVDSGRAIMVKWNIN